MCKSKLTPDETRAILEEIETKTRQLISLITGLISLGLSNEDELGLVHATGNKPGDIFLPYATLAGDIQKDIEELTAKLFKTVD